MGLQGVRSPGDEVRTVGYPGRLGRRGQAEVLSVMAMALVLAVLVGAVVRFAVLYRQAAAQLEERSREVYQALLTGGIRGYVNTSANTVYLASGVPLRVYARYVQNFTHVLWGETSQTPIMTVGDQYVPVYQGPLAGLVYRGEAQVVLVTDRGLVKWDPVSEGGGEGEGIDEGLIGSISRLYPLLATYLKPEDYIAVTDQYVPVNLSVFTLPTHYATQYPYNTFVYVEVRWNSTHYTVTYYRYWNAPALATVAAPIPSSWSFSLPERVVPYHSACSESSGVRFCFDVYAVLRGYCDSRCYSPPSSRWYFGIGMRVVFRVEPVDPRYSVLVVLNRTTYGALVGRGVATCTQYVSLGEQCFTCSTSPGYGVCPPTPSSVVSRLGGYRPVFWWSVLYPHSTEQYSGYDDGYEEGLWYPATYVSPGFTESSSYAYTLGSRLNITYYKTSVYVKDYVRDYVEQGTGAVTYKYGYYQLRFETIYDEGGLGADAKVWDYRVVVFLMKPRS